MGQAAVAPCAVCRGRKHVRDAATGRWRPCACRAEAVRDALLERGGVADVEVRPLSAFGRGFGRFVRTAYEASGHSVLYGQMPAVGEAALAALRAAIGTGRDGRLVRLSELVDLTFNREEKARLEAQLSRLAFIVVLCGEEGRHSYNGPRLSELVNRRDVEGRSTLVAATGNLRALYGDRGAALLRNPKKVAVFDLEAL